jgi:hypothetical protein
MTTTFSVEDLAISAEMTGDHVTLSQDAMNFAPAKTIYRVPFSMPRQQTYYWSAEWQADERAALGDLHSGHFVDFDGSDSNAALRWLEEPE